MRTGDLESVFASTVVKKVRNMAYASMEQKMERAASRIASKVGDYTKFYDITGNLFNSIAVGVYYKGELQFIVHADGGKAPTRDTLAKGETYNLPYYYSGAPSGYSKGGRHGKRPFKGKVGMGGQTPKDTDNLFNVIHVSTRYAWTLVVGTNIEYAKAVQMKDGHDVLSGLGEYIRRYYHKM